MAAAHARRDPAGHLHRSPGPGWLVTSTGYDRDYAQQHGITTPVISPLYSLFEYHKEMVQFGVGLSVRHPYKSQPWDWFVITRPVAFYYQSFTTRREQHVASGYTGPWVAGGARDREPGHLVGVHPRDAFCLGWWLTRRDWRAGVALLCVAAGWVTWLPFVSRTKFYYYALEFEPFMIICIVLCLGLIIGPATARLARSAIGPRSRAPTCSPCLCCSGTSTRYSRARSSRTLTGWPTCGTAAGYSSRPSRNLSPHPRPFRLMRVFSGYVKPIRDGRDIS